MNGQTPEEQSSPKLHMNKGFDRPIVLKYIAKKSKRIKYSKGLRDSQRMEAHLSKAVRRAARAVAKGASTYEEERSKSASNKRDGALKDFMPNLGEALGTTLNEGSHVPAEIAKAFDTKASRRMLRNQLCMASGARRLWRL